MDEVREDVGAVVGAVPVEEVALLRAESEAAGQGEAVVGQVEPVPVGEDVAEVGVEVDELLLPQESGDGVEALLHQRAGRGGVVRAQLGVEPVVEGVRHVLQEQGEARGGGAQGREALPEPW
ncbi:hypothetical protein AQI84_21870 [Streptomyces griseorubiginosus]|nr:hypothetical protein AQI84_21870 [Streptomyces griseorubiginosus]